MRDDPLIFPILIVSMCIVFNLSAVLFLLEGITESQIFEINGYEYLVVLILGALVLFYYLQGERYKKIVKAQKKKKQATEPATGKSIFILTGYFVGSFLIALVCAMFKNGDGIFAQS